jgi:hypothetical protein
VDGQAGPEAQYEDGRAERNPCHREGEDELAFDRAVDGECLHIYLSCASECINLCVAER